MFMKNPTNLLTNFLGNIKLIFSYQKEIDKMLILQTSMVYLDQRKKFCKISHGLVGLKCA